MVSIIKSNGCFSVLVAERQKNNSNSPTQRKEIHWFVKHKSVRLPALCQLFQWNSWYGVPLAWWAEGGHTLIVCIWEPLGGVHSTQTKWTKNGGGMVSSGKLKHITRSWRNECLSMSVFIVIETLDTLFPCPLISFFFPFQLPSLPHGMYQIHFHFVLSKLHSVLWKIFQPLSDLPGFLAIDAPVTHIISTFANLQPLTAGPQYLTVICLGPPEGWVLAKPHFAHLDEELEVLYWDLRKTDPQRLLFPQWLPRRAGKYN